MRNPSPNPTQRARRVRFAFATLAAGLAVTALLAVAYVGSQRLGMRPFRLRAGDAVVAQASFRVADAFELIVRSLGIDGNPEQAALARNQFASVQPVLAEEAQLQYFAGEGGTEDWILFVPFRLSGRSLQKPVRELLLSSGVLAPRSPEAPPLAAAPPPSGYFEILREGLVVTSRINLPIPPRDPIPAPAAGAPEVPASAWHYESATGFLPTRLRASLPIPAALLVEAHKGGPLVIEWAALDAGDRAAPPKAVLHVGKGGGAQEMEIVGVWPFFGKPGAP